MLFDALGCFPSFEQAKGDALDEGLSAASSACLLNTKFVSPVCIRVRKYFNNFSFSHTKIRTSQARVHERATTTVKERLPVHRNRWLLPLTAITDCWMQLLNFTAKQLPLAVKQGANACKPFPFVSAITSRHVLCFLIISN